MSSLTFTLEQFGAGEAERISGVPAEVQRSWRRHKFLPSPAAGKAKFDVIGLAELMAFKALGERGIGPTIAQQSTRIIAINVALMALSDVNAIAGVPNIDEEKAHALAFHMMSKHIERPFPPYFIIWADGSHDWTDDLTGAFGVRNIAGRFSPKSTPSLQNQITGAVIIVDTYALGDLLRQKAGRPLASVTLPQNCPS